MLNKFESRIEQFSIPFWKLGLLSYEKKTISYKKKTISYKEKKTFYFQGHNQNKNYDWDNMYCLSLYLSIKGVKKKKKEMIEGSA